MARQVLLVGLVAQAIGASSGCGNTPGIGTTTAAGGSIAGPSSTTSVSSTVVSGTGGASVGQLGAACVNPPDGGADAGAGGTGGAGSDAGSDAGSGCGDGLTCVDSAINDPIFGGGAPGGFCTKACTGDPDCATLNGICYTVDSTQPGRCTLPCRIGPRAIEVDDLFTAPTGELHGSKCLGRDDVRCANAAASAGVCLPTCGSDADCNGRRCDPALAVCVDTPSKGDPTGASCDPTENPSRCAGKCVLFQTGTSMCSSPCVLGGAGDAGALTPLPNDCGGPSEGICAFHPVTNGPGDTGYCTPACTQHSDCQAPAFWCFSVTEITPSSEKGYCFAATTCTTQADCTGGGDAGTDAGPSDDAGDASTDGDAGETDGGDAGDTDAGDTDAGDAGDDGGADGGDAGTDGGVIAFVCTPTPFGSFCLDPTYPLGTLPDAGAPDASTPASDAGDAGDGG